MQDQDYDLSAAPERKVMGLPAKHLGAGLLVALVCFLYAYGIETQEFICSFGASDRETPELGLIIIGLGRVGRQLLDELLETTMHSKLNAIEPVPGGPRFRILCLGDSTATLCSTKPYVEPVTVDVSGMDARQLAAVLHHKQDEQLPLRKFHFTGRQTLFRDSLAAVESMPHHLPGGGHIVVVDLSGSELTGPTLVAARRGGGRRSGLRAADLRGLPALVHHPAHAVGGSGPPSPAWVAVPPRRAAPQDGAGQYVHDGVGIGLPRWRGVR